MSDTVIRVENLSKKYIIRHQQAQQYTALRDVIADEVKSIGRRFTGGKQDSSLGSTKEEFWALKDVSFEVKQGDRVGIIGRNGAGKSTLLKILSRIVEPTKGEITLNGRVASLLEVGTGFHPELTGRENIYLNGAILGMSRIEIKKKFDEIVDFAEIEKFLDTPVKRYSSGMYVRLAFAVAAHLEPEILIVDEVLAVGDTEFQKKCLGKMNKVAENGKTILFVSHNMLAIKTLCQKGILLQKGSVTFNGDTSILIDHYTASLSELVGTSWQRKNSNNKSLFKFEEIDISLVGNQPFLKLFCDIKILCEQISKKSFIAVDICDSNFSAIMQALPQADPFIEGNPGLHEIQLEISLPPLITGRYGVNFWIGSHYSQTLDCVLQALSFEVTESPTSNRSFPHSFDHGYIVPFCRFKYEYNKN